MGRYKSDTTILREKIAFYLRKHKNFSYEKIGELFGVGPDYAKTLVYPKKWRNYWEKNKEKIYAKNREYRKRKNSNI